MDSERYFANDRQGDRERLMSAIFQVLWRVDGHAPFGKLLRRIDDAIVNYRCHQRIVRLNRMLERDYSV